MRSWVWIVILLTPGAAAWGSFQSDARNTGLGPDENQVYESVWWQEDLDSFVAASPVVADGVVVVADRAGTVHALDAVTGRDRWNHEMNGAVFGTPAIALGRVFVADETGLLEALDLQTGDVLAEADAGETRGHITVNEGKVVLGNEAGEVRSYTMTLDLLWTFDTAVSLTSSWNNVTKLTVCGDTLPARPVRTAPAVAEGVVVFGSMNHHVYAVDEHGRPDGTTPLQWVAATGDIVLASPLIDAAADKVLVGSYDEAFHALPLHPAGAGADPCFGTLPTAAWAFPVPGAAGGSKIHSSAAFTTDRVVFGSNDGHVYAVDATGKQVWDHATGGPVFASPVIANGTVIVGSDDGVLRWLDLQNGSQVAGFTAAGPIKAPVALDGNATYLVTESGTLYRLAPGADLRPDWAAVRVSATTQGVSVAIQNLGNAAAPGTTVQVTANGTALEDMALDPMEPGEEWTLWFPGNLTDGVSVITVDIDPGDQVAERDEANHHEESVFVVGEAVDAPPPAPAKGQFLGLDLWAWIAIGGGFVLLAGGLGFWLWWRSGYEYYDEDEEEEEEEES